MSCAEFNMKLTTLEDNFNQIFIMKYINETVIYAREKDNFYVSFTGYGIFLKFDKCIDNDDTSHIILANIFNNEKYGFDLNAKLESHSQSFDTIVSDSLNTVVSNFLPLYEKFISRYKNIGVSRNKLLAYLFYITTKYNFFYFDLSDEDINYFISHQKPTSNDDLTLYESRDLHTEEEAQLTAQSITTPFKVNKEARGTKRRRDELDEDSSSDEGDSHELGGSTIKDNSDIDSSKVNVSMKKDSEHGVLNSSIENNKDVIIPTIIPSSVREIRRIFNTLGSDLSIIIDFKEGKIHRKRQYDKLVFEKCKNVVGHYYNIYLYSQKGDLLLELHHRIVYVELTPRYGVRLGFYLDHTAVTSDPLSDGSKDTEPKWIRYIVNNYTLSTSSTNTETNLKKFKKVQIN